MNLLVIFFSPFSDFFSLFFWIRFIPPTSLILLSVRSTSIDNNLSLHFGKKVFAFSQAETLAPIGMKLHQ